MKTERKKKITRERKTIHAKEYSGVRSKFNRKVKNNSFYDICSSKWKKMDIKIKFKNVKMNEKWNKEYIMINKWINTWIK